MSRLFLAAAAGLLYAVSFPSYGLWPCAWVWAVPLLILLRDAGSREAFFYGTLAGVVAWAGLVYWIAYVMCTYGGMGLFTATLLLFLLIIYLALYFGLFAWLSLRFIHSRWAFLAVPGLWALFELARSYLMFSGFPWALLGYSQFPWKAFIQAAEIGGVYLIGAVVLMGNVALYQALRKREIVPVLASACIVAACVIWGGWRMHSLPAGGTPIRAAVAQGNIAQDMKWSEGMIGPTLDTYERLTRLAVKEGARVVIWPETSCPFYLFREWPHTSRIIDLSRSIDAKLIVGSPACEEGRYLNRMWLLEGGGIGGFYDKVHLVPFGEYLPLASLIEPFFSGLTREIGNFSSSREASPIDDIGVLICFESIFPGLTRDLSLKGASYLVNASNDAWFKTWSTPEQHLQMASFRAVESRRWLLRSVNHGISAVVSPSGEIKKTIGLLQEGIIVEDIAPMGTTTLYTRFGPVIVCFWAGLAVIAALTIYKPGVKSGGS